MAKEEVPAGDLSALDAERKKQVDLVEQITKQVVDTSAQSAANAREELNAQRATTQEAKKERAARRRGEKPTVGIQAKGVANQAEIAAQKKLQKETRDRRAEAKKGGKDFDEARYLSGRSTRLDNKIKKLDVELTNTTDPARVVKLNEKLVAATANLRAIEQRLDAVNAKSEGSLNQARDVLDHRREGDDAERQRKIQETRERRTKARQERIDRERQRVDTFDRNQSPGPVLPQAGPPVGPGPGGAGGGGRKPPTTPGFGSPGDGADEPARIAASESYNRSLKEREESLRQLRVAHQSAALATDQNTNSMRRNGVMSQQFITAAARGEASWREWGSQIGSVTAKFGAWALAGGAVYGGFDAARQIGQGAVASADVEGSLGRVLPNLDADKAQTKVRELSKEFNVSMGDAEQAVFLAAQRFGDLDSAVEASKATLLGFKVGDLGIDDASRLFNAIAGGLGLSVKNGAELKTIFDQLNQAQNNFGARIEDTTKGAAKSIGAFKNAGGDFTSLLALITTGSQVTGRTGENVGTAIQRSAGFIERPSNQAALRAYGIDTEQSITSIFEQAMAKASSFQEQGKNQDIAGLATALSSPQYASYFTPILLAGAKYDEIKNDPKRGVGREAAKGSAENELDKQLSRLSEQISSFGTGLQQFGGNLLQSGALTGVLAAMQTLLTTLNTVNSVFGYFNDTVPKVVRQLLAFGLTTAAAVALVRRFTPADLGQRQGVVGRVFRPTLGSSLRREEIRTRRLETASLNNELQGSNKNLERIQVQRRLNERGLNEADKRVEQYSAAAKAPGIDGSQRLALEKKAMEAQQVQTSFTDNAIKLDKANADAIARQTTAKLELEEADRQLAKAQKKKARDYRKETGIGQQDLYRNNTPLSRTAIRPDYSGQVTAYPLTGGVRDFDPNAKRQFAPGQMVNYQRRTQMRSPQDNMGSLRGRFRVPTQMLEDPKPRTPRPSVWQRANSLFSLDSGTRRDALEQETAKAKRAIGDFNNKVGGTAGAVGRVKGGMGNLLGASKSLAGSMFAQIGPLGGLLLGIGAAQIAVSKWSDHLDKQRKEADEIGNTAISATSSRESEANLQRARDALPNRFKKMSLQELREYRDNPVNDRVIDKGLNAKQEESLNVLANEAMLRDTAKRNPGRLQFSDQLGRRAKDVRRRLDAGFIDADEAAKELLKIQDDAKYMRGSGGGNIRFKAYLGTQIATLAAQTKRQPLLGPLGLVNSDPAGVDSAAALAQARQGAGDRSRGTLKSSVVNLMSRIPGLESKGDKESLAAVAENQQKITDSVKAYAEGDLDTALTLARGNKARQAAYQSAIGRYSQGIADVRQPQRRGELDKAIRDDEARLKTARAIAPALTLTGQGDKSRAEIESLTLTIRENRKQKKILDRQTKRQVDALKAAQKAQEDAAFEANETTIGLQTGVQGGRMAAGLPRLRLALKAARDAVQRAIKQYGKDSDQYLSAVQNEQSAMEGVVNEQQANLQANQALRASQISPSNTAAVQADAVRAAEENLAFVSNPANKKSYADITNARAALNTARNTAAEAVKSDALAFAQATAAMSAAQVSNADPVTQARVALSGANTVLAAMQRDPSTKPSDLLNQRAQIVQLQNGLAQANLEMMRGTSESVAALQSSRTEDPVKQAQYELQAANRNLEIGGFKTPQEKNEAKARKNNATTNYRNAKTDEDLAEIDFLANMDRITTDQEIARLEKLIKVRKMSKAKMREIRLKIHELRKQADEGASDFDLNVGDVRLPSMTEIRRAVVGRQQGMSVTNRNTVNVNVASQSDVPAVIDAMERHVSGIGKAMDRAGGRR